MIIEKRKTFGQKVIDYMVNDCKVDVREQFFALQEQLLKAIDHINKFDNELKSTIEIENFEKLLTEKAKSFYNFKRQNTVVEEIVNNESKVYLCKQLSLIVEINSNLSYYNEKQNKELLYNKAKIKLAETFNKLVENDRIIKGVLNNALIIHLAMINPSIRTMFILYVYSDYTNEELNSFLGEKIVCNEGALPNVFIK